MEAAVAEARKLFGRLREKFDTHELTVRHGSFIVEILPSIMQKGNIAADTWKEHSDADFVLCLGDDLTDEDMFKSLLSLSGKEGFSSDVLYTTIVNYSRHHPSFAKYQIPSVDEVIKLLGGFADSEKTSSI
ncbi:hypothetical protein O181_035097 [Austropuccinia psidii MF-1]|uniref:Trehalose 6-phosphate phosphatase n=1 Tax=Austropuccinia psidii MF-1 TaxID=1389203 RepID=A0A9Q3D4J3_9BASI|nr:hypothetical protein [Austropuccinia psidii MF-1]